MDHYKEYPRQGSHGVVTGADRVVTPTGGGGGGGTPIGMCAPKGMVFKPFWYQFRPFLVWNRI